MQNIKNKYTYVTVVIIRIRDKRKGTILPSEIRDKNITYLSSFLFLYNDPRREEEKIIFARSRVKGEGSDEKEKERKKDGGKIGVRIFAPSSVRDGCCKLVGLASGVSLSQTNGLRLFDAVFFSPEIYRLLYIRQLGMI